jgi:hypothetical protein
VNGLKAGSTIPAGNTATFLWSVKRKIATLVASALAIDNCRKGDANQLLTAECRDFCEFAA